MLPLYPMLDSVVIAKLLANKETLDKNSEAHLFAFVCEQIYGNDWDAYYAACDLHVVAFGAKTGAFDPPPKLIPKSMCWDTYRIPSSSRNTSLFWTVAVPLLCASHHSKQARSKIIGVVRTMLITIHCLALC
jgi:hypothetical protein